MKHLSFKYIFLISSLAYNLQSSSQHLSKVWAPDLSNGQYKNPIIHADYSDPDICRVGDDFYMTSSSFNAIPALPILHSTDLVNWKIINHAVKEFPGNYYDIPQHGNGVWAPCIRHHDSTFYIYWGDPDQGIFMIKTTDPTGDWSSPTLVKKAYGNIDPSPLWDDDGRIYMVHAFAHSRAGVKSILQVNELSKDGSRILDKGQIVFDGHKDHPTIEGPKFYKRNGYYYIFAPAGGVSAGWQVVLRSKNVYGPYEDRTVMAQEDTPVNGPHQGGWVEPENGENWFVHFQDRGAYGRILHLQPVRWVDDWPVMGLDDNHDGSGKPVLTYQKPALLFSGLATPSDTDEFNENTLGPQWQWNATPKSGWYALDNPSGQLQLFSQTKEYENLWMAPNLLLQKFPAEAFTTTTKLDVSSLENNEEAGLIIFGMDYATIALRKTGGKLLLSQKVAKDAVDDKPEQENASLQLSSPVIWLRAQVKSEAMVSFSYSLDGKKFTPVGERFKAREGKWVGAKMGLYAARNAQTGPNGNVLFDWFKVTP